MNKSGVIARVSELTSIDAATCRAVIDALDHLSGPVLKARFKGELLDQSGAAGEIADQTGVAPEDCRRVLAAFEQTFGEELNHKFRFFRRNK